MGISTRWVCHTCKTIYDGGGFNDYFCVDKPPTIREAKRLKQLLGFVMNFNDISRLTDFLVQYISWREYHKGHKIQVANDYRLEMSDVEYEYNEEDEYHQNMGKRFRGYEEDKEVKN